MLDQLALLAIANLVKFLRPKAGIHLTYAGLGVVFRMIADSFNLEGVALNIFQWRIQGWCGLQAVASWLEPSCSEHKPNNQLLCMLLDLRLTISAQNTVRREWAGQLFYIIVQHWVLQQDRSFMLWTLESWWLQPIHRSRADLGNESYPQRQTADFCKAWNVLWGAEWCSAVLKDFLVQVCFRFKIRDFLATSRWIRKPFWTWSSYFGTILLLGQEN